MRILHFADLHIGVDSYGKIDPVTGMSSRMLDFLAAFDTLVDHALGNDVDLVVFCGDAFKSRDPSPTQQREFAKRLKRLSENGIAVYLLVGNHDLPNATGKAASVDIYSTLGVPKITVSAKPEVKTLQTKNGPIQIASLPWLRKGNISSADTDEPMSVEETNRRIEGLLTSTIEWEIAALQSGVPAILAAHVLVQGASFGSERSAILGDEYALLVSNLARVEFDYIALGHIHKHQVLAKHPPIIYAGSLERLDFGEEADEKGFYVVDIDNGNLAGRRQVKYHFIALTGRRFITIKCDLDGKESDATAVVISKINEYKSQIKDAIVRVMVDLPASLEPSLRDCDIKTALKEAHYASVSRNILRETRTRLGDVNISHISREDALVLYLKSKHFTEQEQHKLLRYAAQIYEEASM